MKIGIIGAGFTGLAAAYELVKNGDHVTVFERDNNPGGLALGFKEKKWQWTLEQHYHHWFTNDTHIIDLAAEIGHTVVIKRPKTSVYTNGAIFQLDSPFHVLTFPLLSLFERLHMGIGLGYLRFTRMWRPLEKITAASILPRLLGKKAYEMIWEPLLKAKFGQYKNEVSLAWFWGRISKRTSSLAYPEGGYLSFANALVDRIKRDGGKVLFDTEVLQVKEKKGNIVEVIWKNKSGSHSQTFDKVIITLPGIFFTKIAPQMPVDYKEKLTSLKGLGAVNLILRLKEPFFTDNTYWLSICDKAPVLAVVEHTNYMDKKYYNNEHIVYLGNYLLPTHEYFKMTETELLKVYDPFLKKLNPNYKKHLIGAHIFKANFAQPVIPINYSKRLPPFETPLQNVYLANIQQVYPWDRGTTYAVELGQKIAKIIHEK